MMVDQSIQNHERIMTPEESKEKCEEMGLSDLATKYITDKFKECQDCPEEPEGYFGPYVGFSGKIGWGQAWQDIFEDLCEIMNGYERKEVRRVWNEFFME
jgi:hypothetical protein